MRQGGTMKLCCCRRARILVLSRPCLTSSPVGKRGQFKYGSSEQEIWGQAAAIDAAGDARCRGWHLSRRTPSLMKRCLGCLFYTRSSCTEVLRTQYGW